MASLPKITFGMIVLNGEPFLRYNLRALYPFAHEIIVVEGAVPGAAEISTHDGHSTDSTLDTLYRFKDQEDPDDKLQIVTHDGFWNEKDAMSQAYAERATGDYLWQIDADEFYRPKDMRTVIEMLRDDPNISAITFKTLTFWGAPDTIVNGWYLRRGGENFHRLFKWGDEYRYISHRPPTVHNEQGRDLRTERWLDARTMSRHNIFMYHYALLFPKQVKEKCDYYSQANWSTLNQMQEWAQNCYFELGNPFRVHNAYKQMSWLEPFSGPHPAQVMAMWEACRSGKIDIQLRDMEDVVHLLSRGQYRPLRIIVKGLDYPHRLYLKMKNLAQFILQPFKPILKPLFK
jgi:hypothetical protein